jgi:hypothetical protein
MWIGINQLWVIPRINGLAGESGFAKDGARPKRLYPFPPIFPVKNLNIKGLGAMFQNFKSSRLKFKVSHPRVHLSSG